MVFVKSALREKVSERWRGKAKDKGKEKGKDAMAKEAAREEPKQLSRWNVKVLVYQGVNPRIL